MIEALTLRNDILAIISNQLGTYTFPNNSGNAPAIACLPDPDKGWNYPENGTKVSGLEIVIKAPYPEVSANLGGDRTNTYTWEIHLKQWDTSSNLVEIIGLLTGDLPGDYLIEGVSTMPSNDKLLTVEQCKIFLKDWTISVNSEQ